MLKNKCYKLLLISSITTSLFTLNSCSRYVSNTKNDDNKDNKKEYFSLNLKPKLITKEGSEDKNNIFDSSHFALFGDYFKKGFNEKFLTELDQTYGHNHFYKWEPTHNKLHLFDEFEKPEFYYLNANYDGNICFTLNKKIIEGIDSIQDFILEKFIDFGCFYTHGE